MVELAGSFALLLAGAIASLMARYGRRRRA
jgi:hypothetical protein